MAYGGNAPQQPQPQVTVQQSVGGPGPNRYGQFPASITDKQRQKQQQANRPQPSGAHNPPQNNQGNPQQQQQHPLQDYLGSDPDYVNTMDQLRKALADYRLSIKGDGGALDQLQQQFHSSARDLRQQRTQELPQLASDYASRGLGTSGAYAQANSQYNQQFQQGLQDLVNQRQGEQFNILSALRQFRHQIGGQEDSARLEALRRRAAQLGLNV
jgi:hypothetical protein